ncbi:MAG: histidine--tRNA ligase [Ignavibacteria bacterium]|nr:histidine--tRNA ligase [Ignavibacteria bacterium]
MVGKEMYTFTDKGGDSLTLRPEGTAPVVRAFLENSMYASSQLHKLYYIANMFRHEKPQAGRFREHTQFGAEIIGTDSIYSDVELIILAGEVYRRFGIIYKLKINSIGEVSERSKYISELRNYLLKYSSDLSEDSRRRLNLNPLRILDSKDEADIEIIKGAPKIYEYLSVDSKRRFDKVLEVLSLNNIAFEVDYRLVRGLDYYCHTTFEFLSSHLGAQSSIGGGGRYDGLFLEFSDKSYTGAGFGSGIERVIEAAEKSGFDFGVKKHPLIFFATMGDNAVNTAFRIINELRKQGISAETDYNNRSLKSQMREADKLKVKYVFIIGEDEILKGRGILKDMEKGSQTEVQFEKLSEFIRTE